MRDIRDLKSELYNELIEEMPVLRARLGITQEVLAMKVGSSRQTVNSVENRKRDMTWQLFMAIMAVFNHDETSRKMLSDIPGFNEKLNIVLNEGICK